MYRGSLTYASNWWQLLCYQASEEFGCRGGDETSIKWWDALDLIGIDAYYPLPNANCSGHPDPCEPIAKPSKQDLVRAWHQLVRDGNKDGPEGEAMAFGLLHLHRLFKKPIIFTEVSQRSSELV